MEPVSFIVDSNLTDLRFCFFEMFIIFSPGKASEINRSRVETMQRWFYRYVKYGRDFDRSSD